MVGAAKATEGEFCCLARKPIRDTARRPLANAKGTVNLPQVFVFRVAAFLAAPHLRGGTTVVTYKNRQSERTGKLRRHALRNTPAPKGTRVRESGQSQSGKMSSQE